VQIHTVTSLDSPELWVFRTMRWSAEHEKQGVFVAEGDKVVRYLLQSGIGVNSLLLTQRWLDVLTPLLEAHPDYNRIHIHLAESALLDDLTGMRLHQRVLACGNIPETESLESLLTRSPRPWLFAAAENLSNAENLGLLIRNAGAFDLTGVLIGEPCGQAWLRRVVRTSMGAIFSIPVLARLHLPDILSTLKSHQVRCVATHPHPTATPLAELDLSGDVCLVFGAEGNGLSDEILDLCDVRTVIPMKPGFDSLNVVSATGICLHQAALQQGRVGAIKQG